LGPDAVTFSLARGEPGPIGGSGPPT
jgi:hypothetical protein